MVPALKDFSLKRRMQEITTSYTLTS